MLFDPAGLLYLGVLFLVWIPYGVRRRRRHRRSLALLEQARASGAMEPRSLHPLIDKTLCLGCGTCVPACPEDNVLGLVAGKAELVNPSGCIGHGACKDACPRDAITLVLGTESRGIDIPVLDRSFQTNVPGIFVAGELGGMGLVRNAILQGSQALEALLALRGRGRGGDLDVAIVGAGPAGFAASLAAQERGLRAVTIEQETLGGTVAHYPRGKIVMTAPVELPLHGRVMLRETTKEALLDFWRGVERKTGVRIRYQERVDKIVPTSTGFEIATTRGSHRARSVLLAIGRRGTPRKLGVPGEELPKVVYRLVDPEQYRGQRVVVVGGGDSALEAAASLAEEPGVQAILSYRRAAFSGVRPKNKARVIDATKRRRLHLALESQVRKITESSVQLESDGRVGSIENDAVIVCAGGILPTRFLESVGIRMETRRGEAI
jgi:thioredoxin reductase